MHKNETLKNILDIKLLIEHGVDQHEFHDVVTSNGCASSVAFLEVEEEVSGWDRHLAKKVAEWELENVKETETHRQGATREGKEELVERYVKAFEAFRALLKVRLASICGESYYF